MNIGIVGFYGKLGQANYSVIKKDPNSKVAFGVSRSATSEGCVFDDFKVYNSLSSINEDCDGIIDFSNRENIKDIIDYCLIKNIPVVIGTTGLTDDDEALIKHASEQIPILLSHNTGFGINVMLDLVYDAYSKMLDYEIEIIEKHHNRKEDSPSGTSKMIFNKLKEVNDDITFTYGRSGNDTKKIKNQVGFHSVRGGNIISDHDIMFIGNDEIITISHHAQSDESFATGALKGLYFLKDKKNGLYSMKDVLKSVL